MKQVVLTLIAAALGILIGILDTIFGKGLIFLSEVRDCNPLIFIPFLAAAGAFIVFIYKKFGGTSSKGMTLIFMAAHGEEKKIPIVLVPLVVVSTWLTHLFGGSAGREGVAVQIGGTVAHFVGRRLPYEDAGRILIIAGMAAGFSGLFGTPMAATLFALEVLVVGELKTTAILPTVVAAFCAAGTTRLLGLEKFEAIIDNTVEFDVVLLIKVVVVAVIFGLVGVLFSVLLKKCWSFFSNLIPGQYKRIIIMGICLSVVFILLFNGRYSGLGTNLISEAFNGGTILPYDWGLKLLLTVLTLSAGFQGGEVTPLFSIGASLGVLLASLLGMPVMLTAALGYIAVFGSATNTFLAPLMIGVEVFGYANIPYYFIACIIAFVINRNISIYKAQKVRTVFVNKNS